jgi:hypothetical protein
MKMKLRKRHHECPACARAGDGFDPGPDAYMQGILSQVSSRGWAVPGVLGDGDSPPWAYSVGLWASYGHPDLAAFGRPLGELAAIIRPLCTRAADDDGFAVGDEISDVFPARLAIRDVHDSWRMTSMFVASDQFHGYIRPPIRQVVWTDSDGNYPWDMRYEPGLADAQPMLWLPVEDHPPGTWTRLSSQS